MKNIESKSISRRNFLKIVGLASLGFLAGCVSTGPKVTGPNYVNSLRKGDPNTIELSNREIIYNIAGEWEGTYNNYFYPGINEEIVRFEQNGREFLGRKKLGNQWVDTGNETIMGILKKDGFEKVKVYHSSEGWIYSRGKINSEGNNIILEGSSFKIDLNRK